MSANDDLEYITFRDSDLCVVCRGLTELQMRIECDELGDLAFCRAHIPIFPTDPGRSVMEQNQRFANERRSV